MIPASACTCQQLSATAANSSAPSVAVALPGCRSRRVGGERGTGLTGLLSQNSPPTSPAAPTITRAQGSMRSSAARDRQVRRALLLAPSNRALADITARYVPTSVPIVTARDIGESLDAFTSPESAVLALANRYDGIDLPDRACRLIVIAGLPIGADPHERFLAFTLGAKRVLQERMRTRLVQGSGRATRNANDWAAVIVLGHDLVSFAGMKDAQAATHPEVRAELEFGIANSQGQPASQLAENLSHFLAQDDLWRNAAEPGIAGLRDRPTDTGRADADALTASARHEIRAVPRPGAATRVQAAHATERAIDALAGGLNYARIRRCGHCLAGTGPHKPPRRRATRPTLRSRTSSPPLPMRLPAGRGTSVPPPQANPRQRTLRTHRCCTRSARG